MMELFGLMEDRYGGVSGVSMVPGTFNTFPSFHLHSDALLSQPTRCRSCGVTRPSVQNATSDSDVTTKCDPQ